MRRKKERPQSQNIGFRGANRLRRSCDQERGVKTSTADTTATTSKDRFLSCTSTTQMRTLQKASFRFGPLNSPHHTLRVWPG
eukprot:5045737-Pleurochrysis_carterae.AAC.1